VVSTLLDRAEDVASDAALLPGVSDGREGDAVGATLPTEWRDPRPDAARLLEDLLRELLELKLSVLSIAESGSTPALKFTKLVSSYGASSRQRPIRVQGLDDPHAR